MFVVSAVIGIGQTGGVSQEGVVSRKRELFNKYPIQAEDDRRVSKLGLLSLWLKIYSVRVNII